MNTARNNVARLVQKANSYNLDDLIEVVFDTNTPEEIRNDLQTIYFHATEALFGKDGETNLTDNLRWAFITMRELIEALTAASDTKDAKLSLTVK